MLSSCPRIATRSVRSPRTAFSRTEVRLTRQAVHWSAALLARLDRVSLRDASLIWTLLSKCNESNANARPDVHALQTASATERVRTRYRLVRETKRNEQLASIHGVVEDQLTASTVGRRPVPPPAPAIDLFAARSVRARRYWGSTHRVHSGAMCEYRPHSPWLRARTVALAALDRRCQTQTRRLATENVEEGESGGTASADEVPGGSPSARTRCTPRVATRRVSRSTLHNCGPRSRHAAMFHFPGTVM